MVLAKVTLLTRAFAWWMLVTIFLNDSGFAIQNGVDCVVAEVQKEWLILVPPHKLNCFLIHPVNQELMIAHGVVWNVQPPNGLLPEYVRPEVGSIADAFYLPGKVPLKAMVLRFYLMGG